MPRFLKQVSALSVLMAASLVVAHVFFVSNNEASHKSITLLTPALEQNSLLSESSSYELQRASEHFSNIVLGWMIDPSFASSLQAVHEGEFVFQARLQEKQNILIEVQGGSEAELEAYTSSLKNLIENSIQEYNAATGASYVIARERTTQFLEQENALRIYLLSVVLAAFVFYASLLTVDYVKKASH
jgi:hypothetical protein